MRADMAGVPDALIHARQRREPADASQPATAIPGGTVLPIPAAAEPAPPGLSRAPAPAELVAMTAETEVPIDPNQMSFF
jgi:hypothetical protein